MEENKNSDLDFAQFILHVHVFLEFSPPPPLPSFIQEKSFKKNELNQYNDLMRTKIFKQNILYSIYEGVGYILYKVSRCPVH